MVNEINPMGQLPQFLEAIIVRIEAMLAERPKDSATREPTEILLGKLWKQAEVMRALVSSAGEALTSEQAAAIAKVPVPQPSLFPAWAQSKKDSK